MRERAHRASAPSGIGAGIPRRLEFLYDAVAAAMWIYAHSAYRVVVVGRHNLRAEWGQLIVSTHRSDSDVPLICARIYFGDRMWSRHHRRVHFAARDDLFEDGVVAGLLPPAVPGMVRRLLFPLNPGRYIGRMRVTPIHGATKVKAVQALRFAPPDALLRDVVPPRLASAFERRGLGVSATVADALQPHFADLLWHDLGTEELRDATALWQHRKREAGGDLRRLVEVVHSGEVLLLFPEGRPSPDGSIGPMRPGLSVIVRRGQPERILPLGIAYDPFTTGLPRACLAAGDPLAPPTSDVDDVILAELRRVTPLTCAQVVASALVEAAEAGREAVAPAALDARLADEVDAARKAGRPVDPPLVTATARRRRLSDCLRALGRLGLVHAPGPHRLELDASRILADDTVRRMATEYASARVAPRSREPVASVAAGPSSA